MSNNSTNTKNNNNNNNYRTITNKSVKDVKDLPCIVCEKERGVMLMLPTKVKRETKKKKMKKKKKCFLKNSQGLVAKSNFSLKIEEKQGKKG